ncbi:ExbD/TolR family protein [Candidatus Latescibacterota bacterium]
MKIRTHRGPITSFNAISLTDIIFLLLIFFLLSSTFVLQPGIKVELPTTTTSDISSEKSIVISLTRDGAIYLNDELVNQIELGARLRRMVLNASEPIIAFRSDRAATIESLIEVMDIAKSAGGDKFIIVTAPAEQ